MAFDILVPWCEVLYLLGTSFCEIGLFASFGQRPSFTGPIDVSIVADISLFCCLMSLSAKTHPYLLEHIYHTTHTVFHHPLLYKRIHKQHHEFKKSMAVNTEYAHPLEHLVSSCWVSSFVSAQQTHKPISVPFLNRLAMSLLQWWVFVDGFSCLGVLVLPSLSSLGNLWCSFGICPSFPFQCYLFLDWTRNVSVFLVWRLDKVHSDVERSLLLLFSIQARFPP